MDVNCFFSQPLHRPCERQCAVCRDLENGEATKRAKAAIRFVEDTIKIDPADLNRPVDV